jgi:hypothetical protein
MCSLVKSARAIGKEEVERTVRHKTRNAHLCRFRRVSILRVSLRKVSWSDERKGKGKVAGLHSPFIFGGLLALPALPAITSLAIVTAGGSKLQDVPLAELTKMCKGTQKAWSDGRSFTLVMKDPDLPEMHLAAQKLFGVASSDLRASIAKANESRQVVRVVSSDEELLHTVETTPGAVGILDVYAINSAVKVLRVDGKLPFDVGYALKGN